MQLIDRHYKKVRRKGLVSAMMEKDVDFRIDPTQRICEKCGNLVGKVFELCPKCGYPAPAEEKGKGLKDGDLIKVTLIISFVVVVIFFLLYGFK